MTTDQQRWALVTALSAAAAIYACGTLADDASEVRIQELESKVRTLERRDAEREIEDITTRSEAMTRRFNEIRRQQSEHPQSIRQREPNIITWRCRDADGRSSYIGTAEGRPGANCVQVIPSSPK